MNKTISLALSILSLVVLQACGGGGGDGTDPSDGTGGDGAAAPAPSTSANTGSVSAPFNRGDSARYQVISANRQVSGKLATSVQETDGAMTTLETNVLGGSKVVKDISGDATYAMGRWAAGTVTTSSGVTTLTETSGSAYHYIAFNALGAIPTTTSGAMTCDAGTFTAPTYVSGGSAGTTGSATGMASLSFGASGAVVGGTINVAASGSSGSVAIGGTIGTPTTMTINGAYLSNGAGTATQIGDGGSSAYLVISNYVATLANGSRYMGIAKFRCS